MVFADEAVGALLALGGELQKRFSLWRPLMLGKSETERDRRGRRSMCTMLGASLVEALTKLL